MNYQEALNYIDAIPKFTKKHSLEFIKEFLSFLGSPEAGKKVIHVAGTNGKGTVCAYLQSMLLASGKKTGCFLSPHLVKPNERICVDGCMLSDEEFLKAFLCVKETVNEMEENGFFHPSYFEFLFGMAMKVFQQRQVEYVVLETGLGGRLDATNVIDSPLLTIITSIGMDHEEILGDSIEKIAGEKAGIIKEKVPLVYAACDAEANIIIQNAAKEKKCDCYKVTQTSYMVEAVAEKSIAFSMRDEYYEKNIWNINGTGLYQALDGGLALTAMQVLEKTGEVSRTLKVWKRAMENTVWLGRMQMIEEGIIIDGAHNNQAIQKAAESIYVQERRGKRIIILFAAMADKSYVQMIKTLCESVNCDRIIVTQVENERSVSAKILAQVFRQYTLAPVSVKESVKEAIEYARNAKEPNHIVYCLGSLYLAGEILKQGGC